MASFVEDGDDDIRGSTLRLKEALTVSDLGNASGFTFEVDTNEEFKNLDMEFLDTGMPGNHYMKDYIGDPNLKAQSMLDSLSPDEKVGDFDYVLPDMTNLSVDGKVKKLIVRDGKAKDVVPHDGKVSYHYVAYAEGKEGEIDSTVVRGVPYSLIFSSGECIPGLFLALQSMKVGEIAKFWFHYDLAYGETGAPPRIPARAGILCVVEMLSALGKDELQNVLQMSRDERLRLPFEKIMSTTEGLKAEANICYKQGDLKGAITRYRKGIDILDNYPVALMAQEESRSDLLGTLYSNIAQCFLKTDQPQRACTAAKGGLRIPKYRLRYKLLFKFAQAKAMLKDYNDALALCQKAIDCLSSEQKEGRSEIEQYMREVRDYKTAADQDLKKLYEKMVRGKGDEVNGAAN